MELYGAKGRRRYIRLAQNGRSISPATVVRAARHRLYASRSRATYLVGAKARVAVAPSAAPPTRAFDARLVQLDVVIAKRVR
jgi:hypothetical protein